MERSKIKQSQDFWIAVCYISLTMTREIFLPNHLECGEKPTGAKTGHREQSEKSR